MTNKDIWLYLKSKNGGGGGESTNAFTIFNVTVTNSEITINGLVDKTTVGDFEIPAKIGGASVTAIGYSAFESCTKLEFIKIPNSVTSIYARAFRACPSLISVEIPNSVTTIRDSSFAQCAKLEYITIPNSVTSIEDDVFYNCGSLTSVEISNSVTSIGNNIFYNCHSLTNVNIPNSVTSIGYWAFNGCTNLASVILEDNFNCNNLDLSASNKYSKETIVAMLNALADRTDETAYTLKLGSTNLAKLSDEDIAIATAKNWTLA